MGCMRSIPAAPPDDVAPAAPVVLPYNHDVPGLPTLLELCDDSPAVVTTLRQRRLLRDAGSACPHCARGRLRDLQWSEQHGLRMRCSACRWECAYRHGSIFADSRLPLLAATMLLRSFAAGVGKSAAAREHGYSWKCVDALWTVCRERLREYVMAHPVTFPADDIVEIDECYVRCVQQPGAPQLWVIGLIGRKSGLVALGWSYGHSTAAVRQVIDRHLPHRNTVTISDKHQSFRYLCGIREHHFSEKRKEADHLWVEVAHVQMGRLRSGANQPLHSNYIEGYWSHFRKRIGKAHAGTVDLLLHELMFRSYGIPVTAALCF